MYRGLPNGTNQDVADYQNIALFWLNETFRENLYRRAEPYNLVNMATDILDLFLGNPRALGSNKGLYNFRASEPECDIGESDDVACFLFENLFDAGAGQISPEIIEAADVVNGLIKGVAGPFFVDFNCSQTLSNYGAPSSSEAGTNATGSASAEGVIKNGQYPNGHAHDDQEIQGSSSS